MRYLQPGAANFRPRVDRGDSGGLHGHSVVDVVHREDGNLKRWGVLPREDSHLAQARSHPARFRPDFVNRDANRFGFYRLGEGDDLKICGLPKFGAHAGYGVNPAQRKSHNARRLHLSPARVRVKNDVIGEGVGQQPDFTHHLLFREADFEPRPPGFRVGFPTGMEIIAKDPGGTIGKGWRLASGGDLYGRPPRGICKVGIVITHVVTRSR